MKPKIVFFGSSDFVMPVRDVLDKNFDLVASFTNPEQKIDKNELEKLDPDLFVVASFGKILKKDILDIPKFGAINIHPSILPKYRGASPIQSAILNGDKITGVTLIKMDEQMDHGPIIFQKNEEIQDDDTFQTLANRLFKVAANNLAQVINDYLKEKINLATQDDSKATFTKILAKNDGFIDFSNPLSPQKIKRMVRAYFPWPGVFFKAKINQVEKIIKLLPEEKIQVEGKNSMSYTDFINGYQKGEEILNKLNLS